MVLRRVIRSPVKAAARTAMSTGFSFAPPRRRSREAQAALEPARTASPGDGGCSAGWLRRHAVEARLQASQALRAGREVEASRSEGPSADGRGTGRVHNEGGAKRSGCVSAVYPR
jgi:hypothetical protein